MSAAKRSRPYRWLSRWLFDWHWSAFPIVALLAAETMLCALIIRRVQYTPIDWRAYMEEVEGPLSGVWDYMQLRGETGPLVYPAGFVYLYMGLRAIAGGDGTDVRAAQWALAVVYVVTQALVFLIYAAASAPTSAHVRRPGAQQVAPWVLGLLCLSKRMHSLYVLRLFNDGPAQLFFYAALFLFTRDRWRLGCILYSAAVSIKMSVLLSAPGLLLLLLKAHGIYGALAHIALCAALQLVLGLPFLIVNPQAYILRAFGGFGDLNQKWSVNWKFVPPSIFHSRGFVVALLLAHLAALALLASRRWCVAEGSISRALRGAPLRTTKITRTLHPEHVTTVLLSCHVIGAVFARSLHFQFYTWYWHAVPLLLWRCGSKIPGLLKLAPLLLLEYAYSYGLDSNEGTSTPASSLALLAAHAALLFAIFVAPAPRTFAFTGAADLTALISAPDCAEILASCLEIAGDTADASRGAVIVTCEDEACDLVLWDGSARRIAFAKCGAPGQRLRTLVNDQRSTKSQ